MGYVLIGSTATLAKLASARRCDGLIKDPVGRANLAFSPRDGLIFRGIFKCRWPASHGPTFSLPEHRRIVAHVTRQTHSSTPSLDVET